MCSIIAIVLMSLLAAGCGVVTAITGSTGDNGTPPVGCAVSYAAEYEVAGNGDRVAFTGNTACDDTTGCVTIVDATVFSLNGDPATFNFYSRDPCDDGGDACTMIIIWTAQAADMKHGGTSQAVDDSAYCSDQSYLGQFTVKWGHGTYFIKNTKFSFDESVDTLWSIDHQGELNLFVGEVQDTGGNVVLEFEFHRDYYDNEPPVPTPTPAP